MLNPDFDIIGPARSELLARIGLDPCAIRDALDDDRIRRCPDRETIPPQRRSLRCARRCLACATFVPGAVSEAG